MIERFMAMKSPKQLLKMKHELKQLTEEELIAADIYGLRQERAHWVDNERQLKLF